MVRLPRLARRIATAVLGKYALASAALALAITSATIPAIYIPPARAAGTHFGIKQLVINGSTYVVANAINNKGVIVGAYLDQTTETGYGFTLSGSTVTILPTACPVQAFSANCVPFPTAINGAGLVTGYFINSNSNDEIYGFTWQVGAPSLGVTFPMPETNLGIQLWPLLNAAGQIAFTTPGSNGIPAGTYFGTPSGYSLIPGLGPSASVNALDLVGIMTGTDMISIQGQSTGAIFEVRKGNVRYIRPPDAVLGQALHGGVINNLGQVAGNYADSNFHSHGFVYFKGRFNRFSPASGALQNTTGINNKGRVVGVIETVQGQYAYQNFYLYNGSEVGIFGGWLDNNTHATIYINDVGVMLGRVDLQNTTSSYRILCGGTGC